ncbi:MAG: DMT family transporter [Treponema sp.]|jgi:drug/metabolite transporter (DMT)-like permease|nr:DMT family transporter [Treponema sp.]
MNKRAMKADALLLLTAGLWGFGFVAQSSGMNYVGPFTYNALRFPLGSLSLLPLILFFRAKRRRAENGRDRIGPESGGAEGTGAAARIRMTLLAGTVLFIAVALQQIGIIFTTVGNAGFITGFYVVLTPVFGMVIGKKTGLPTWAGMICALAGLYFIFLAGNTAAVNPGDLITLSSAVFWAIHILLIDHMVRRIDPLILSAGQFAWCGLFFLAAALTVEPLAGNWAAALAPGFALRQWNTLPDLWRLAAGGSFSAGAVFEAAIPVLYGGLASVGIAYTLQVVAQKDAPPAHATILLCLEGAFAALGGILLQNEKPGPFTLLGFAFMLCAMLVTQWDVIGPGLKSRSSGRSGRPGRSGGPPGQSGRRNP